jgi:hypothetical protein
MTKERTERTKENAGGETPPDAISILPWHQPRPRLCAERRFLLPATTFPNEVFTARLEAFVELKRRWKVAIAAQIYRCSDLGLFTEHQILNMRKQISARRWRKTEPLDNEMVIERPSLINRAVSLLLENHILTRGELLSGINISPGIIESLSGLPEGALGHRSDDTPVVELK